MTSSSDPFIPVGTITVAADEFDLDAWIDGAKLPEKSVTVYGRADLVAEFEQLNEQLRTMKAAATLDDGRLSGDPQARLARRMEDVRTEMQSSALTFRFRAILKEAGDEIRGAAPKDSDGDPDGGYVAAHWIAAACVSPAGLTAEKANAIRARIGEGQYAALWNTAWSVSNDRSVSVPFSLAASELLSRPDSSPS